MSEIEKWAKDNGLTKELKILINKARELERIRVAKLANDLLDIGAIVNPSFYQVMTKKGYTIDDIHIAAENLGVPTNKLPKASFWRTPNYASNFKVKEILKYLQALNEKYAP